MSKALADILAEDGHGEWSGESKLEIENARLRAALEDMWWDHFQFRMHVLHVLHVLAICHDLLENAKRKL